MANVKKIVNESVEYNRLVKTLTPKHLWIPILGQKGVLASLPFSAYIYLHSLATSLIPLRFACMVFDTLQCA